VVVTFALQQQSEEEEEEGPAPQQRKQMRFFFFFLLPIGINVRIPDTTTTAERTIGSTHALPVSRNLSLYVARCYFAGFPPPFTPGQTNCPSSTPYPPLFAVSTQCFFFFLCQISPNCKKKKKKIQKGTLYRIFFFLFLFFLNRQISTQNFQKQLLDLDFDLSFGSIFQTSFSGYLDRF
jgi:hypothetical protein